MADIDKESRACGALIRDGKILMVKHVEGGRSYWTLPGGGVQAGESFEAAVAREVREETGLVVFVQRLLWEGEVGSFYERCFLLGERSREDALLGSDPELSPKNQIIKDVSWFALKEKASDVQVSKVLKFL